MIYIVMTERMITISNKIKRILDDNKINDLKRFIEKRQHINHCNVRLRYIYYISHYASILITTMAIGYRNNNTDNKDVNDMIKLIWIGISLNVLSTLINAFENMNKTISKRMLSDINKIKSGNYVDETEFTDSVRESGSISNNIDSNQSVIPI